MCRLAAKVLKRIAGLTRTRAASALLALLLGLVGFWVAPADMARGQYRAEIQVTLPEGVLATEHAFRIGQSEGDPVTRESAQGAYRLVAVGSDALAYRLGQVLRYRVQLVGAEGQAIPLRLEQVTSEVIGPDGYRQSLPATQVEDGWLVFALRLPFGAKVALGLLFAVAVLWLTEVVPMAAAALLIPVVVVAAGITDAKTVLQPFSHPIIMLFLAGFLMAQGMVRTGVDRRVALTILRYSSGKPAYLMLTMMVLTAFLSMWMSNTASVALIVPIALAVLDRMPAEVGRTGFRRALILGVAYAGTVGGVGSAIGTPANILAVTFLREYAGSELSFVDWFGYGVPVIVLMLPLVWLYLLLSFRVKLREVGALDKGAYADELGAMGEASRGQWTVILTFVGVVALWLTEQWHGLPPAIVALAGASVLFVTTTIQKEDLNRINWNALLTFGGGLAIGSILVSSGISDWVALQLAGLQLLPPLLVVLIIAAVTLVTGAFISNTATAAMLIPMAIPLAQMLQIDPRLLVAVIAIASSIDFALVVGTPPTMIAYSTGLFESRDIFRRGVVLDLLGVVLLSFGVVWIWQLLGVISIH